ncbi:MAG TPA: hypothetical protein VF101_17555 [Gaiellaceae bacterium]
MKRGVRIALLLGVIAAALAFAGGALAAYTPKIVVSHDPLTPQGGGKTDIAVSVDQNDDATARVLIYVPQGYTGSLGTPGQQVGTAEAQVLTSIAPTQPIPVTGAIVADDPSKYVAPATQCTGTPTHAGVWLLRLEAAGQQLTVPAYVDPVTAAPEAALGSFKITVCLPSPYIPPSAGGATLGAKLVSATLHLTNVFVLPAQNGSYGWTLVATPWTVGAGTINAAGTVQARGFVNMPVLLGLTAKYSKKTKSYMVSGKLTENLQGLSGVAVQIFSGTKASSLKRTKTLTTGAGGSFSFKVAAKKTQYFQARVSVAARSTACTVAVPGIPCATGSIDPFSAKSTTIKTAKRKK